MFGRTSGISRRKAMTLVAAGAVCLLVLLAVHHATPHSDGTHGLGDAACPICVLLTSLFIAAIPVLLGCVNPPQRVLRPYRRIATPPSYLGTTCLRRGPPASAF